MIENNLPILLKRSGESVPNLDDARSMAKSNRPNEILNATVNLGTLDSGKAQFCTIGLPEKPKLF